MFLIFFFSFSSCSFIVGGPADNFDQHCDLKDIKEKCRFCNFFDQNTNFKREQIKDPNRSTWLILGNKKN